MKKFYYLSTCNTCTRIREELGNESALDMREIKSQALSAEEADRLAAKAGSYEAIFSKRAIKYRQLGLNNKDLSEKDYRHYLLEDYTFLKRPVLETEQHVLAGNSKKIVSQMKEAVAKSE